MCDRLQVGSAGAGGSEQTDIAEKIMAFNQISQSAVYKETEQSVTLSVCGGSYGGGSECLIVTQKRPSTP